MNIEHLLKFDKAQLKDGQGRQRTKSLFLETIEYKTQLNGLEPIFTFRPANYKGCISLKQLYLAAEDPYEYEFALQVFGSWEHWQKLLLCDWFQPEINKWRDELEIKLKSKAIQSIIGIAINDGAKGMQAAKWLAEGGWKGAPRGRPSKEDVERETKIQAGVAADLEEYYSRLEEHQKAH